MGPVAGGLLIEANLAGLGWRSVFLVNGPVGLLALLAGAWLLPAGAAPQPKALDIAGTLLATATLLALLLPLIQGPESGWPAWCWMSLVLAGPLGWGTWRSWQRRQARDGSALVSPLLLALPAVQRGLLVGLALHGVVPAYLLAMTFVVQGGLGATPYQMALLCLPIAGGAALSIAALARHVVPRLGHWAIVLGAVVQGIGVVLAASAAQHLLASATTGPVHQEPLLLGAHALLGLGIGLIGPALSTATLKDVPLAEAGSASGVVGAVQQLAAVAALALVGGLLFAGQLHAQDRLALQQGLTRAATGLVLLLVLGAAAARRLRV